MSERGDPCLEDYEVLYAAEDSLPEMNKPISLKF